MKSKNKAAQNALKFMQSAMNDPDMPPETRRKCAETILERALADEAENVKPHAVYVTYQVIE